MVEFRGRTHEPRKDPVSMSEHLESLLTPGEVAEYLGVTRKTLSEWKASSYGPKRIQVGRRVFFRLADVNDWIKSRAEDQA